MSVEAGTHSISDVGLLDVFSELAMCGPAGRLPVGVRMGMTCGLRWGKGHFRHQRAACVVGRLGKCVALYMLKI